jgi:hypothetical protein
MMFGRPMWVWITIGILLIFVFEIKWTKYWSRILKQGQSASP